MFIRTARLAQEICEDLQAPLVALCVLKGGYQFFTDLLDFIKNNSASGGKSFQMQVDFIRLKSYVVSEDSCNVLCCVCVCVCVGGGGVCCFIYMTLCCILAYELYCTICYVQF